MSATTALASMADGSDPTVGRAVAGALAAAAELAPVWRSRAERAEEAGSLPQATVDELFDAGLLQLLIPRRYGGLELGWRLTVEVSRIVARACASTAWIIALGGGHAAAAARFPAAARVKIFEGGARQLIATAAPSNTGLLSGSMGALRIGGLWRYGTGVDHATWIMARCFRPDDLARGARPSHFALLDPRQVEIRDASWKVMGMRATGSKGFVMPEESLADMMCASLPDVLDGWSDNGGDYAYDVPFRAYYCTLLIGAILGCAEGAFDSCVGRLRDGHASAATGGMASGRLGESSAKLAGAAQVYGAILDTLHVAGRARQPLSLREQARLGRDRAYLARLCVEAVQLLILQAGTQAMAENDPLCRHWRDVQVMASHSDVSWDRGMQTFGEHVLAHPTPLDDERYPL